MKNQVDILLSTYNGEKYIEALLDSIIKQNVDCYRLLVRDDGSRDNTVGIVEKWQQNHPERIELLKDDFGNLGVTNSMLELIKKSSAPYLIFCDQDDVWFPEKVRTLYQAIRYKEKGNSGKPVIIHCEAYTTDEDLNPLGNTKEYSMQGYQSGRNKRQVSFGNLLLSNPVQGASMIFNRALVEELEPIRNIRVKPGLIYDSLLTSVCSIRGNIYFLNRPLMYYRQHAKNVVGSRKRYLHKMKQYTKKEQDEIKTANYLLVNYAKCDLLRRYYRDIMSQQQRDVLEHFMKYANDWSSFVRLGLYREFSFRQILIMVLWKIG